MKKHLAALALLLAAGSSWSAICAGGDRDFGTVQAGDRYSFGTICTALAQDPADPSTWTFTHTLNFTLADIGGIAGSIDLHYTRAGWANPQNPGAPWLVTRINPILLVHDGITTRIGGEGAGHDEWSHFHADGLEAGDYALVLQGQLFNVGARSGLYSGELLVSGGVAPPVPEPETLALLIAGVPLVLWAARRKGQARRTPAIA